MSTRFAPRQPAYCAQTEFECDCNCGCQSDDGDPNHECDWPECGCECKVDCEGCKLVQEQQEMFDREARGV